jgi:hypothetical protein
MVEDGNHATFVNLNNIARLDIVELGDRAELSFYSVTGALIYVFVIPTSYLSKFLQHLTYATGGIAPWRRPAYEVPTAELQEKSNKVD